MLTLELLVPGQARDICVLVTDNRCAAKDYISGLQEDSQRSLMATLQRMADTGWAGHGTSRIRRLKGSHVACEVKEHKSNTRLLFFLHGRRLVVCTHGVSHPGKPEYRAIIRKVEALREECLREGILS